MMGRRGGRGRGRRLRGDRGRHTASPNGSLTLSDVRSGSTVRVVRVQGGKRLVHRLAALGLVPGAEVTVTRSRGPALLSLHGTSIAVGHHAALAVEVEEAEA